MKDPIERRLVVLEHLLAADTTVHPPACNCAIMSRVVTHHDRECPYRLLSEMIPLIRSALGKEGKQSNG